MRFGEVKVISLVLFIIGINIYACKEKSNYEQNSQPTNRNEKIIESTTSKEVAEYFPSFKIKNKSKLKVDLLYFQDAQHKVPKEKRKKLLYLPDYEGDVRMKINRKELLFLFYNKVIKAKKDSVQQIDFVQKNSGFIKAFYNSINNKTIINSTIGDIRINNIGVACDDTGYNRLVINTPTGDLVIDYLLNVEMFLTDLDNDKKDEMYIVSFRSCSHELSIIRIK